MQDCLKFEDRKYKSIMSKYVLQIFLEKRTTSFTRHEGSIKLKVLI